MFKLRIVLSNCQVNDDSSDDRQTRSNARHSACSSQTRKETSRSWSVKRAKEKEKKERTEAVKENQDKKKIRPKK